MSQILVVGSLAYDTISTPLGKAERTLGGSANYFSVAAANYTKVSTVGVVGDDYSEKDMKTLTGRSVDVSGLQKVPGKTFHWEGQYKDDMNEAITLNTELNVFADFDPTLNDSHKKSDVVFLANIDPDLQLKVLEQVEEPKLIASDTMNFWIGSKRDSLLKVIEKIHLLTINEGEALQLSGAANAVAAAKTLAAMGPKAVVIKRGEYGFLLYMEERYCILPAYPIATVVDPTGAGDTFAGGLMGYLSQHDDVLNWENLKEGCIDGTIFASFTIQDFGLGRLSEVTKSEFESRKKDYKTIVTVN